MKIFITAIFIFLFLLFSGCYTKNDLIQRQIDRDKFKVTVIKTKQGITYNFTYHERLLTVRGDFLDGALVNGTYKRIPISDIISVNDIPFKNSSPVYLHAVFGIAFLATIWYAATKH
jgi:hypothetical protein